MASFTRTPHERAAETTLQPLMRAVLAASPINGIAPWTLPLGVFHRTRRHYGLQYCPVCLKTDEDPYFRRSWRMAYQFVCPDHQCLLMDACACGAPVIPHKSPRLGLSRCYACYKPLVRTGEPATPHQMAVQRDLVHAVNATERHIGAFTVPRPEYMAGIRSLMLAMAYSLAGKRLRKLAAASAGVDHPIPAGHSFETLRVHSRAHALSAAHALLINWPHRFHELCSAAQCSYGSLIGPRSSAPRWIEAGFESLPNVRWSAQRHRRRKARRRALRVSWATAVNKMNAHGRMSQFMSQRLSNGRD